jgi:SM-20-related protein
MNKLYEVICSSLVNQGYCIVPDAFNKKLVTSLLDKAHNSIGFKQAGISAASKHHVDIQRRRDTILWLNEDMGVQSEYLSLMGGLQEYLNRHLFLGLSYYESHFAIYNEGDFYEKHVDSFKNSKNRVVTSVYYLNSTPKGGELLVYDENEKLLEKVLPQSNKLVIFLSDQFPHEVLKAESKRYSIAGWFRVDKI